MTTNHFTKDGLTGNSGLGVEGDTFFHISANYAARTRAHQRAMCFVEWFDRGDPVPIWRRMTVARATKEGRAIIRCAQCSKPAISVDHYWPYMNDTSYCEQHRPVRKGAE